MASKNSLQGLNVSLSGVFRTSRCFCGESLADRFAWTLARLETLGRAILKYRVWFIAVFQAVLIFCGLLAAWLLRFNFFLPDLRLMLSFAPVLIVIRLLAITQFGLMHGWWRYTGISDAIALSKATFAGSIVFVLFVRVVFRNAAFPRTIYALEPLISIMLLGGVRVLSRIVAERFQRGALRGTLNSWVDFTPLQAGNLENLLGRDPVKIDLETVRKLIAGQTILVTGAAGTIGAELCRQVLRCDPAKLVCLDRNETGMFYLQTELWTRGDTAQLVFCVTDFGDAQRMQSIFREHKPSVIFHAAAYKHVPMMETNVYDAVKNNIFAFLELLEISEKNGCPSFVLISSDKAVNPINVMGATKRVGELIVSSRPAGPMRCVSVRFGNVLGSSGSVVPILQKQLRDHQQLTITHPEATRFFMTTHEAVSLVLQAFAIGRHGDTLLLEMGLPVRILDLARTLIRLSGKSERDVKIRFTGLRDGEKLFEELSYRTEGIRPTSSPRIGRIPGAPQGWLELKRQLDQLRSFLCTRGDAAIRDKVKEVVPEYSPRDESEAVASQTSALERNSSHRNDELDKVLHIS